MLLYHFELILSQQIYHHLFCFYLHTISNSYDFEHHYKTTVSHCVPKQPNHSPSGLFRLKLVSSSGLHGLPVTFLPFSLNFYVTRLFRVHRLILFVGVLSIKQLVVVLYCKLQFYFVRQRPTRLLRQWDGWDSSVIACFKASLFCLLYLEEAVSHHTSI